MNTSNKVTLIGYTGSDKLHVLNAWASTFLEAGIEIPDIIEERTDALVDFIEKNGKRKRTVPEIIQFLATETHSSPFRASHFILMMTEDVATHIHLLKHKVLIKHENAESARYKQLKEDKFYLPEDWLQYGSTGRYWYERLKESSIATNKLYHQAIGDLVNCGMPKARARESARYFKQYNSQLNVFRTISFDGLRQLHEKRGSGSASQLEVSELVDEIVRQVAAIPGNPFEHSLKAWGLITLKP